ncbi:D-galacturonate reductase-like [Nicotiana sylvestris]|uniref:D-galacturonate reductase-like n=1 Tax=Nicotiana sylvestris TaxID=4096 RepID=A0A1U7YJQ2_NICSY|nr:PREDICTED: D-galacturonate reductase-like [Nicotiana sylvestris]
MQEVRLNNCDKAMPVIGMGTASSFPPAESAETVKSTLLEAIKAGYRHFDTAFIYPSENPLGEAIVEALHLGIIKSRDELFITTKLWSTFAQRDQVVPACKLSLQNLQLEYVDMYLIHMPLRISETIQTLPVPKEIIHPLDIKGVWEGMEECKSLGLTKGIGVSNFSCKKLEELLSIAKIPPAINQVEMNPMWQQKQLREFCKAKGIQITAYSPLGSNNTVWGDNRVVECDVLTEIAKSKGKTTAQVALRWVYEQGVSLVTKSFNKERMKENLQIFDWSLSREELKKISELPQRRGFSMASLYGPHDIFLQLDAEI